MKKIIVIFLSISITLASNNELFEKLSKALKNKFNIHTLDDLNRLKSKNKKNQESILNRTRNMSDFIGEWASVSQEVSMHITVGTDQSVPEMGSIMGMNPANGGITVSNDNFTTELNYMMAVDPFGGLNLSSAFNNSRIERDTETYIFEFESLSDMNYARYGAGYATDNEYIYAFGGADSEGVHNHGERYDPDTDTWEIFVEDLIPRRYTNAEYMDGYIYLFNGDTYTSSTYTDTIEIINVSNGEVDFVESNPYPVEYGGSAVWEGKIYIFGGSNGDGYSNRVYEFDPFNNSWTRLADMPESKQTSGKIIDGILYTFGGYNGAVSTSIHSYDIEQGIWITDLAEMPFGISAHSTVSSGDYLLVIGDYAEVQFTGLYDPVSDTFSVIENGFDGRRHSSSVYLDGYIYAYGGAQPEGFNGNTEYTVLQSVEKATFINYGTTGAFNFAQWYVYNYSSNWGQEPFDLGTEFNIEINGSSISGGLGGNDPAYCEINWPEDPYHLAIYSFVSEYVLEEGGSIGCFLDDFNLDQTYADVALEMEGMWTGDDDGDDGEDGGDIIFMNFDFMTLFGIMFGVIPDSIDNPMLVALNIEDEMLMAQTFDPISMYYSDLNGQSYNADSSNYSFSFDNITLMDSLGNEGLAIDGIIEAEMLDLIAGEEAEIPFPSLFSNLEEVPEMYLSFYSDSTGREIMVENMDYYGEYYTQIDTSFFEWYATNDSFFIHFENDDYYYYYDSTSSFEGLSYSMLEDTITLSQEIDPCDENDDYYYYYQSYEDCIGQLVLANDVVDFYQRMDMNLMYIGTVSVSEDDGILPKRMKLYPAYPNPFNPVATIQFDIAENRLTNNALNIYDITGKLVAELINKEYNAGTYKVTWDASSFASGVYFTELISGSERQTQKIILLK